MEIRETRIREIEKRDNEAMEQIIRESLEEARLDKPGTAYYDPEIKQMAETYENNPAAKYWVIVNEADKVIGGVGIGPYPSRPDVCELQKLYIAWYARGLGFSKRLMNTALEFAKKHYTYCYIETSSKLPVASRLYEQFGFETLDAPLEGSEHGTMDIWYMKTL